MRGSIARNSLIVDCSAVFEISFPKSIYLILLAHLLVVSDSCGSTKMTIFLAQKNRIFQDFKNFQQQIIDFCICILYDVMFARSTKHLYSQDLNSQYITTKLSLCKRRRSRITSYSYLQSRKVRWLREMFPMPCIISSSSDFWFNFQELFLELRIACHLSVRNHETCPL